MPKNVCNVIGHHWQERDERYSSYSTQSVGSYWVCRACGARSDEKPADGVRRS